MLRRKIKRRKGNFYSKLWRIGVLILTSLILFDIYLLYDSKIFEIKNIEAVLDKVNCVSAEDIKKESQILGQNFFLTDNRDLEKKLKEKYFCIQSVNFKKTFPNKVKIEVSGRVPIAILALLKLDEASQSAELELLASPSASLIQQDEVGDQFLVDGDGLIFSKLEGGVNLPKLYFWTENLALGKKFEGNIIKSSLRIMEKIKSFGLDLLEARIYSNSTLLLNPTTFKPKMIFALERDIEVQLASLQLILEEAKIEEQEMEFVDLRFDKPVVKYILKKGESSR